MEKTKKQKAMSLLLALCMAVVMLAGSMVFAPVTAKAAAITQIVKVTLLPDMNRLWITFGAGETSFGSTAGKTITVSDDTNTYTFSSPGRAYAETGNAAANVDFSMFKDSSSNTLEDNFDPNRTYKIVIEDGYFTTQGEAFVPGGTFYWPQAPAPNVPDAGTDAYYERHYNFWLPVLTQLSELGNSGTLTVDTQGQRLDHIQHFVFDQLDETNRTLVVRHEGETYRINGRNLGGIALGHNHLFYGNLDGYR